MSAPRSRKRSGGAVSALRREPLRVVVGKPESCPPARTILGCVSLLAALCACGGRSALGYPPWTVPQLISPQELARELTGPAARRPAVVCVGFRVLYLGAHIRGAPYEGPARNSSGLMKLKNWAAHLPKDKPIVIYCGCCPMRECPNVRPAFDALRRSGFTHLRALDLPASFAKDWVAKGYPVEREK